MSDWLPQKDAALRDFVTPMSALITSTPAAFGLGTSQASVLASDLLDFTSKLATAQAPETRGPASILAKENSKKILTAEVRAVARQVQGCQSVTDEQRQSLGLPIRRARTPVPPPATSPKIDVVSVVGRTVTLKLHDGSGTRRGRPVGVDGAAVFSYVGTAAPTDPKQWQFEGNTTRVNKIAVTFPDSVAAGAQVFFTSFWFNERKQSGPGTPAVGTNLQGGSAMAA